MILLVLKKAVLLKGSGEVSREGMGVLKERNKEVLLLSWNNV
jgi:hypothetical protein